MEKYYEGRLRFQDTRISCAIRRGAVPMKYAVWLLSGYMTLGCMGCAGLYNSNLSSQEVGQLLLQSPAGAFYQQGHLLLYYDLSHDQIFFSAVWPADELNSEQHSFQMALLDLAVEPAVSLTDLQNSWRRVTLYDFPRWRNLVNKVLEQLSPQNTATASLVTVQHSDLVLYRDPKGKLVIDRLLDKPADLRIDRYITEEEFSAEANKILREEMAPTGINPEIILFAVGEDDLGSAFVLFDLVEHQSVFIALTPSQSKPLMGLDYSLHMVDALTLRSHVLSVLRQPVTLTHRLLWLTAHSGVVMLPRGISQGREVPPVGNRGPMDLAVWEQHLDRIVGHDKYPGSMDLLIDGEAFFKAFIEASCSAQRSIDIRLYIFDSDDYALRIADLLKQRSNDIRVRVLIDRIGTLTAGRMPKGSPYHARQEVQRSIVRYLRSDSDVQVRIIDNPWLTSDHTKVIVIDHHKAFVGGMNIGYEYRYAWHDLMVEVVGPIVGRLSKDFDKRWAHAGLGGDLAFAISALKPESYEGSHDEPHFFAIRPLYTRTGDPQILRAQLAAIRQANSYIYIQQPYVSDDQIIAELISARRRGVDVRFILPSGGDSGFMDSANLITAKALLRNGIRVYIYPGMTHVKAALYDGWAIVGSANFDKLSLRINQETNLATSDPHFAERLKRELFEVDFARSIEWTEAEPVRWRDYIAKAIAEQL